MHRPAIFAAVLGLGRAASNIGDHWVQNDHCARVKGATDAKPVYTPTGNADEEPVAHGTADGIKACAWHCLTYTATQAAVVGIGARVLGIRLHPGAAAAALAVSGITHYIADRRVPGGVLETLATKTGKSKLYRLADHGMNGAYALDQAWHEGWEAVAALVATTRATAR
ncbi:hypothetical protein [Streptomyces sp. NPDC060366]|uniref:hypothetical protein n=1 Tax=Streptomyces sp. NPDC060366 TaxID=3347105 RepID=UPI0036557E2A